MTYYSRPDAPKSPRRSSMLELFITIEPLICKEINSWKTALATVVTALWFAFTGGLLGAVASSPDPVFWLMIICLCSSTYCLWTPTSSTPSIFPQRNESLTFIPWNHYDAVALMHAVLMAATWFMYLTYGCVPSSYGSQEVSHTDNSPFLAWPRKPPDPTQDPLLVSFLLLSTFDISSSLWTQLTPYILLATLIVLVVHHRSFLLAWMTLLLFCLELGIVLSTSVMPWVPLHLHAIQLPFIGYLMAYIWLHTTPY